MTRNTLITSFLAASCGGAWMAWNAFEDHLVEVRKGSIRFTDTTRTTEPHTILPEKILEEPLAENRSLSNNWGETAEGKISAADKIEEQIDNPYHLRTYREAKDAWAQFKNRPPTAVEAYSLLKKIELSIYWQNIVDISSKDFYKLVADQAQRAIGEMTLQTRTLNPQEQYRNYKLYSELYRAMVDSGRGEDGRTSPWLIEDRNPGIDLDDPYKQKNQRWPQARDESAEKIIRLYRQGLKMGSPETQEFFDLFEEFDMGTIFRRAVPEITDPTYGPWLAEIQKRGLTPEEGARIIDLITELNRRKDQTLDSEKERLQSRKAELSHHP